MNKEELDIAHDRARYAFEGERNVFLDPERATYDAGQSLGFEKGWDAAVLHFTEAAE
jgi:hypothetical protein